MEHQNTLLLIALLLLIEGIAIWMLQPQSKSPAPTVSQLANQGL